MKRYPRIIETEPRSTNTCAPCVVCRMPGDIRAHIQISNFRGDDYVVWTHKAHSHEETIAASGYAP